MSFTSRDLMIDVLPTRKFTALAQPGLGLCAQGTATGLDEDEEEEDDLECALGTATGGNEPTSAARSELNLAALRRQLRETMSA
ncbi:MAG TPA: hypothetical protein VGH73_25210 [Thermoanaerobaculia bacterium]|jgi:hypothetical protein